MLDWIGAQAPTANIPQCFDRASELRVTLEAASFTQKRSLLQSILRRVTLSPECIRFTIDISTLVDMLRNKVDELRPATEHEDPSRFVMLELPVSVRRRGAEMRLIVQSDHLAKEPDASLVILLARAHLYLQHLTRQADTTVADVATHFSVDRADVGRILPLAFLAPRLVEQMLNGDQPDNMSARTLARSDIPHLWTEQLSAFG